MNCRIISENGACVGMGSRGGEEIVFRNCELLSRTQLPCIFLHDSVLSDLGGETRFVLDDCFLQKNSPGDIARFVCMGDYNNSRLWLYRELERDSFHIYLLHDPVNYVILAVFAAVTQKLGTVRPINWNAAGMVLVLLRIFGTIGVCVAALAVLRRIKPVKTGWLLAAVCIFSMTCVFCFG